MHNPTANLHSESSGLASVQVLVTCTHTVYFYS